METHQKYLSRFTQDTKTTGEITKYFLNEEYAEGSIIRCELEAGIEMVFFNYLVRKKQTLSSFENENIMEIFYCLGGDIGLEYSETVVKLKENMIGAYDFNVCPKKVLLQPGRVKGISLLLDVTLADCVIKNHLSQNILTIEQIRDKIAEQRQLFLAFGNQSLRSVFLSIADNPFDYDREYLLLKALELILISSKSIEQGGQKSYSKRLKLRQHKQYEKAVKYMEEHMSLPISVQDIAEAVGISERLLNQYFMEYSGQTVYACLKDLRLKKAQVLLTRTELPITEIAGQLGWQNPSKFSSAFKLKFGMTPKEYRKQ
jgi:AraC-like DNA-binding protein